MTAPGGSYEIFETTADVGFSLRAETTADIFRLAAEGLTALTVDASTIGVSVEEHVSVTGPDNAALLVNWLNELIGLRDKNGFIGKHFEITTSENFSIKAVIKGELFDPAKHKPDMEVKAATYHLLKFEKSKTGYQAKIILDI